VFDLLRLELADELPQQLAIFVAPLTIDLDRRQHVAIPLRDRKVQPQLVRNEAFELVTDGPDQPRIGTEVGNTLSQRVPMGCGAHRRLDGVVAAGHRLTRE
jgi:hypothetical protein